MSTSTWTIVIGGVVGVVLALLGARMLVTGKASASAVRAFRSTRDAGWYHLLFGVGLLILVGGLQLPGIGPTASAVAAIALAGTAVVRFRPRRPADKEQ